MSKQSKSEVVVVATPEVEQPQLFLTVKGGQSYRGARAAWYERMVALQGYTKDEVLANLEADRPSVYGTKSKHCGSPEPVAGWVRFFERTGVATWKA